MTDADSKLFPNKTASTLTTEKILGAHCLDHISVQTFKLHLNRVGLVAAVVLKPGNRPRALDRRPGLFDLLQKNPLDFTLVQKSGERVSGVDETRATGPAASALNTLFIRQWIPEGHVVHLGWLVGHHLALQAQVAQNFRGSGLNAVRATSGRGHGAIVNMLDLVAPAGHTKRQQHAHWACANNDDIISVLRLCHGDVGSGNKKSTSGEYIKLKMCRSQTRVYRSTTNEG